MEINVNNPLVSVIINCFNGERFVREALESVYAQTYKDWEIVFWDNASSDSTPQIAKTYDKRLRYFRSETKLSLGEARNYAVGKATGKYIAFLDSDDIWLDKKLEKQVKILDTYKDVALVYSNYFRLFPDNTKRLALRGGQPEGMAFERLLKNYCIGLSTTIIRKEALDSLDATFDKNLTYSEDFDVIMRVLYNSEAAYCSDPLAVYRIHPAMSTFTLSEAFLEEYLYVLDKFKKLDPVFETKYSVPIAHNIKRILYQKARIAIENGDFEKCRRTIRESGYLTCKLFLLYILSWLPRKIYLFFLHCSPINIGR